MVETCDIHTARINLPYLSMSSVHEGVCRVCAATGKVLVVLCVTWFDGTSHNMTGFGEAPAVLKE